MKKTILIDFDSVVYNSVQRFLDLYETLYEDSVSVDEVDTWGFDECIKLEDKNAVEDIFAMENFYFPLELDKYLFEDCIEVVSRLKDKYNILICTAGTSENNINKIKFCEKYLPKGVGVITLQRGDGNFIGKDMMKADLILDDHETNLMTNQSIYKVLFKNCGTKQWNENWKGDFVTNWLEFEEYVEVNL